MRKAWISDVDDYARITFDRDLRFQTRNRIQAGSWNRHMVSSDHSLAFDPGCDVILELKCYTSRVPMWMLDMIRCFDLQKKFFKIPDRSFLSFLVLIATLRPRGYRLYWLEGC